MKSHDSHDLDALKGNLERILARAEEIQLGPQSPIVTNTQIALQRVEALRQTEVKMIDLDRDDVPFGLFVEIHETQTIAGAFSSWFRYGDTNRLGEQGIVGAAHSVEAWPNGMAWQAGMERDQWPEWTKVYKDSEIIMRPGGLDIVLFGVEFPDELPPDIKVGDRIGIMGFPAGVTIPTHAELRVGTAYMERNEDGVLAWIIMFDNGETLAMGGMSGGVVFLMRPDQKDEDDIVGNETVVATLITQNSRTDVGQGQQHGSDVTELRDALRIVQRMKAVL